MAERRPLVLDGDNQTAELPSGDTTPVSTLTPGGAGTLVLTSVDGAPPTWAEAQSASEWLTWQGLP